MNDFKGLHFVTGEKGGVGKSLFTMVFLEYLNKRKIEHKFYDADRSSPDVGLAYGESSQSSGDNDSFGCFDDVLSDDTQEMEKDFIPAEKLEEVESEELISQVYFSEDQAESFKADRLYKEATNGLVVVNLPAQVENLLDKWLSNRNILEDDSLAIYYWFVTDGSPESLTLLERSLKRHGKRINHIIVRNKGLNKLVDKGIIRHPVLKTIREAGIRKTVEMPELILSQEEMEFVKTHKLKLSDVIEKGADIEELGSLPKLRTRSFLKQCHIEIDRSEVFTIPIVEETPAPDKNEHVCDETEKKFPAQEESGLPTNQEGALNNG